MKSLSAFVFSTLVAFAAHSQVTCEKALNATHEHLEVISSAQAHEEYTGRENQSNLNSGTGTDPGALVGPAAFINRLDVVLRAPHSRATVQDVRRLGAKYGLNVEIGYAPRGFSSVDYVVIAMGPGDRKQAFENELRRIGQIKPHVYPRDGWGNETQFIANPNPEIAVQKPAVPSRGASSKVAFLAKSGINNPNLSVEGMLALSKQYGLEAFASKSDRSNEERLFVVSGPRVLVEKFLGNVANLSYALISGDDPVSKEKHQEYQQYGFFNVRPVNKIIPESFLNQTSAMAGTIGKLAGGFSDDEIYALAAKHHVLVSLSLRSSVKDMGVRIDVHGKTTDVRNFLKAIGDQTYRVYQGRDPSSARVII